MIITSSAMRTQLSATPTQTAQTTTCHSTYTSHGDRKRQQLSSSYFRFAHTKNRNCPTENNTMEIISTTQIQTLKLPGSLAGVL